jgi:hypothetical protein
MTGQLNSVRPTPVGDRRHPGIVEHFSTRRYDGSMFAKQSAKIFQRDAHWGCVSLCGERRSGAGGLAHAHAGCLDSQRGIGQTVATDDELPAVLSSSRRFIRWFFQWYDAFLRWHSSSAGPLCHPWALQTAAFLT